MKKTFFTLIMLCFATVLLADPNEDLIVCARVGDFRCVQAALDAGGDVNFTLTKKIHGRNKDLFLFDPVGTSVLQFALSHKKHKPRATRDIVKLLVEKKADVNYADPRGDTALLWAVRENSSPEIIKILINAGARLDHADSSGSTPLLAACRVRDMDIDTVKILLKAGASVNARSRDGAGPLGLAKANERKDIVKLLLKHGAKE